jgi:chorismate synthase
MVALVLADVALEKFGGDSVAESSRNHKSYLANLSSTIAPREWAEQ